jgi:hypothetical protein
LSVLPAYTADPERFVRKPSTPPSLADTVWINPPDDDTRRTRYQRRDRAGRSAGASRRETPADLR